ncbi:hypothetical protein BHE74_00026781 [Ensete ventricosum]|nr:hypothetical protein BHE74_00026781 [Ensete ventricosum]
MGSRKGGVGVEDGQQAAIGMPSFISSPVVQNMYVNLSVVYYVTKGFFFFVFADPEVNPKPSVQTSISGPSHFDNFSKIWCPDLSFVHQQPLAISNISISAARVGSLTVPLHRGQQPHLVSLASGQFENWGETTMADASPRTDTSTDVDADDKNHKVGIFISSSGDQSHAMSGNGVLAFDTEYARWREEHNRQISELRTAVNAHASENDLRAIVDGIMAHYDEIFKLKGTAAKADVFHMLSGMWKTPAERCFLWLGGFRSSELLKLLTSQLEPLTEQQLMGLCNLQQSSHQAEDALSQGMEALQQSLAETLAGSLSSSGSSGNVANYMGQMAMAMGKLGTLENFLCQVRQLLLEIYDSYSRVA